MNQQTSTKVLYKRATNGKTQIWSIQRDANMFRTSEGYIGGANTLTAWTICEGKNLGRANETSPEVQAEKEVAARIKKQKDKGWFDNLSDVDEQRFKEPMSAKKFKDHFEKLKGKELATQPKLDGIRAETSINEMLSRTGKMITCAPHIQEEVTKILQDLDMPGVVLDGELYNHDLYDDFNEIASIVRTQNPTVEDLQKSKELMQYHVFDIIDAGNGTSFKNRFAALKSMVKNCKHIHLVETIFCTFDELDKHYDRFRASGYEGQMIRIANSAYQHKRTTDLQKRKEFVDEEFEITDILEGRGNRAGVAARVVFKTKEGYVFKTGLKGTMQYCKKLLANKEQQIGKMGTVRYQNLTPGDQPVPRFGKMIEIRDYE